MDPYIRDINYKELKTYNVATIHEYNQLKKIKQIQSGGFTIIQQNIRSISQNFDEFILHLKLFEDPVDCIVLTETYNIEDTFQLENYNVIYNQGNINKNDGVIVYLNSQFQYTYENVQINECKILQIKFKADKNNVAITAAYRPPSTNAGNFVSALQGYLEQTKNDNNSYNIFIGDINIDLNKNDDVTNDYLDTLYEHNYMSTINENTRSFNDSNSCIDHIFLKTNKPVNKNSFLSVVVQLNITDHFCTLLNLDMDIIKNQHNEKKFADKL